MTSAPIALNLLTAVTPTGVSDRADAQAVAKGAPAGLTSFGYVLKDEINNIKNIAHIYDIKGLNSESLLEIKAIQLAGNVAEVEASTDGLIVNLELTGLNPGSTPAMSDSLGWKRWELANAVPGHAGTLRISGDLLPPNDALLPTPSPITEKVPDVPEAVAAIETPEVDGPVANTRVVSSAIVEVPDIVAVADTDTVLDVVAEPESIITSSNTFTPPTPVSAPDRVSATDVVMAANMAVIPVTVMQVDLNTHAAVVAVVDIVAAPDDQKRIAPSELADPTEAGIHPGLDKGATELSNREIINLQNAIEGALSVRAHDEMSLNRSTNGGVVSPLPAPREIRPGSLLGAHPKLDPVVPWDLYSLRQNANQMLPMPESSSVDTLGVAAKIPEATVVKAESLMVPGPAEAPLIPHGRTEVQPAIDTPTSNTVTDAGAVSVVVVGNLAGVVVAENKPVGPAQVVEPDENRQMRPETLMSTGASDPIIAETSDAKSGVSKKPLPTQRHTAPVKVIQAPVTLVDAAAIPAMPAPVAASTMNGGSMQTIIPDSGVAAVDVGKIARPDAVQPPAEARLKNNVQPNAHHSGDSVAPSDLKLAPVRPEAVADLAPVTTRAPEQLPLMAPVATSSSASSVHIQAPAPTAPAFQSPLPVSHDSWSENLGERILWISGHNLKAADIQLNPPELGPLQVKINTHRDGSSIHFSTHSAVVRDMVEQSLPRLRDMFESSGMNLLDVNESHHRDGGRQQSGDGSFTSRGLQERFADGDASRVEMDLGAIPLGLVDFYA